MRKFLFCIIFSLCSLNIFSQNVYDDVYTIFQNNCMPCHNNTTQTASLDLEGSGGTIAQKMAEVYANLYKQTPSNSVATNNNNFLIYPGDPYKSFLYRKIDHGLTAGLTLNTGEGVAQPNSGAMTDKEIELIRQWILYGAQETGTAFDKTLMENYYNNGGIESVENPPVAPPEGEGFQIHLGPFYLEAGGEIEYFSKYDLLLENDIEVHKLKTEMGSYSHHFINYKFSSTFGNVDPNLVPYGMRTGQDFDGREFVSVDQYSNTLTLPQGAAFLWEQSAVLDLNSHYINYSNSQVLKCEVFYNVYTQPTGTANQIMEVSLIPNTDIPIPNDNQPVTFNYTFQYNVDIDIFLWGLTSHTHSYGKDFNIYKRTEFGTRGEQIYDAGCANGRPGCAVEDFDYSHLPIRFFNPFEILNIQDGIDAEATYQNDGPNPVNWGFTSDDEMMIFVAFILRDTTGVKLEDTNVPSSINENDDNKKVLLFPNPSTNTLSFNIKEEGNYTLDIMDLKGRSVLKENISQHIDLDVSKWQNGLYFYLLKTDEKIISKGKFLKK